MEWTWYTISDPRAGIICHAKGTAVEKAVWEFELGPLVET